MPNMSIYNQCKTRNISVPNSAGVSRKAEDAYPCSKFLVESELRISFSYFVCRILVTLCPLLCLSVFHVWSLFLDYILLISTRILVPLNTLIYIKIFPSLLIKHLYEFYIYVMAFS